MLFALTLSLLLIEFTLTVGLTTIEIFLSPAVSLCIGTSCFLAMTVHLIDRSITLFHLTETTVLSLLATTSFGLLILLVLFKTTTLVFFELPEASILLGVETLLPLDTGEFVLTTLLSSLLATLLDISITLSLSTSTTLLTLTTKLLHLIITLLTLSSSLGLNSLDTLESGSLTLLEGLNTLTLGFDATLTLSSLGLVGAVDTTLAVGSLLTLTNAHSSSSGSAVLSDNSATGKILLHSIHVAGIGEVCIGIPIIIIIYHL